MSRYVNVYIYRNVHLHIAYPCISLSINVWYSSGWYLTVTIYFYLPVHQKISLFIKPRWEKIHLTYIFCLRFKFLGFTEATLCIFRTFNRNLENTGQFAQLCFKRTVLWDKVLKCRPSKISGRQPLKTLKGYPFKLKD